MFYDGKWTNTWCGYGWLWKFGFVLVDICLG